jgi:ATP-dependent DNA helicase DinG
MPPPAFLDAVRAFFAPGGSLERLHSAPERRPAQERMALEVAETLLAGGHLVVEAGTGVGKTLAYLVPAALLRRRVVISTGTKALQDQLLLKDIPFLERALGPVNAAVLKGRDNYLCKLRFAHFARQPSLPDRTEAALWPQLEAWAKETAAGEVSELSDFAEAPSFWGEINARSSTCLGQRCELHAECHLQELRRRAREARIVVVNHHLFLADAAMRDSPFGQVLPEPDLVVFDEAHRLEAAATSFFGRSLSNWRVRELADDVSRELHRAGVGSPTVRQRGDALHEVGRGLARAWGREEGRFPLGARLSSPQEHALDAVTVAARQLQKALDALPGRPAAADPLVRRCEEMAGDAASFLERDDPAWVNWFEVRGHGVVLTATPVDVSDILRRSVFEKLEASVCCSATLAVDGRMTHFRGRVGLSPRAASPARGEPGDIDVRADVVSEQELPVRESLHASPFAWEEQALLYLPPRMPDPRQPGFVIEAAQQARALLDASRGRAFLLFTSFENLRKVHEMLREDLPFPILVQGEAPKREILRRFQEQAGSVLFATSSFWEGIDVPGEALSLVVIDKLPFAVPTDPVVAARTRLVVEAGGDGFRDLALPEAILTLKQGVGRLIRSRADRGVIALLDPRVRTPWGRGFLTNLPPMRRTSDVEDVRAFFDEVATDQSGRGVRPR